MKAIFIQKIPTDAIAIQAMLARLRGRFDTIFAWHEADSLYRAGSAAPVLGPFVGAAKAAGFAVQLWAGPTEVEADPEHPEWKSKNKDGSPGTYICFARPDARAKIVQRFASAYRSLGFSGFHLEELSLGHGCWCDYCRAHATDRWFSQQRASWNEYAGNALISELYDAMPGKLSTNGVPGTCTDEWYWGRNWTMWHKRALITFFAPQTYEANVTPFVMALDSTLSTGVPIVPILDLRQPAAILSEQLDYANRRCPSVAAWCLDVAGEEQLKVFGG